MSLEKYQRLARQMIGELSQSLHLRFSVANGICGLLPNFSSGHFRSRVYRAAGLNVDASAFLMGNITVLAGRPNHMSNLEIQRNVRMATGTVLNLDDRIIIEENVTVGPFVKIFTSSHSLGHGSNRCDPITSYGPVRIGKGTWIGLGASILSGVTIGPGCVIAAGTVVSGDVPANSLVQGVPGTAVSQLPFGNR